MMFSSTFTITLGDAAENHVGMQKIGKRADNGFTTEELLRFKEHYEKLGKTCEFIDLGAEMKEEASLLIVRNAIDDADGIYEELNSFEWDKKFWNSRRKVVLNKRARYNVCFADESQDPDYEGGKGRIVSWDTVPLLAKMYRSCEEITGRNLQGEGNHYYEKKAGIGWHGDSERSVVIGTRFGKSMRLAFWWYLWGERQGERFTFTLNHGDMYFMHKKAVGTDWKKRKILTLRHSAGSVDYTC